MFHILVVEDNDAVALGLQHALQKEGFVVHIGASVSAAKRKAETADLVILDIRLPDGDGFEYCQWMRTKGMRQPVLMLTARDELVDKIIGLEVGADDYLTKPFEVRELIARVRALLRRAYGPLAGDTRDWLSAGPLDIDLTSQLVKRNGEELHLTNTEYKLLVFLARNRNRPQSRDSLIEHAWGYEQYFGDLRTVDVHIRNLRKKIELDPSNPQIIQTIHGVGYKLSDESEL